MRPLGIDSDFSEPLLSSDLEWMLRSNQANVAMIVEAIVQDYYPALYRLALSILNDAEQARQCLDEALLVVADKTQHIVGEVDVHVWLYMIVINLCIKKLNGRRFSTVKNRQNGRSNYLAGSSEFRQCLDNMGTIDKLIFVLHFQHNLAASEISYVMNLGEQKVKALLLRLKMEILDCPQLPVGAQFSVKPAIQEALHKLWPAKALDEATRELLVAKVVATIKSQRNRQKSFAIAIQVLVAGAIIALIAAISWLTAALADQAEVPKVVKTVVVTQIIYATLDGQSGHSNLVTPSPEPLHEGAMIKDVLARMQESRRLWRTLWLDGQIIEYGPPGYAGFPFARREQVWVSQPGSSLVLSGWAGGEVDRVRYSVNGRVSENNVRDGSVTVSETTPGRIDLESAFESFIFPELFELTGGEYRLLERDQISGRTSLILEGTLDGNLRHERVWVDASSGVVLRRQLFANDGVSLLSEIMVRKIVYDAAFPVEIFDSENPILQFSTNYYGQPFMISDDYSFPRRTPAPGHRRQARATPPDEFNPSDSLLQFQWIRPPASGIIPFGFLERDHRYQSDVLEYGNDIPVNVYAGGYYLGQVELNPWEAKCDRSADGSTVAVISLIGNPQVARYDLHWFRLDNVEGGSNLTLDITSGGFPLALDREGQRLAFYGCNGHTKNKVCGVYLADLESGSDDFFLPASQVLRLEWSADNNHLTLLEGLPNSRSQNAFVFDVHTGQMVYVEYVDQFEPKIVSDLSLPPNGNALGPLDLSGCVSP